MPVLILDSSVALSFAFEDEYSDDSKRVLDAIRFGGALVPPLWAMEVANILANGIHRNRISEADAEKFLTWLAEYPIETFSETPPPLPAAFFQLARRHGLTAYDAAYLRLALATGLPLASKDNQLNEAARQAGITLFP
ncbi:MAG: type II toxin-antitoxin system VapC family toxin [Phycisphaerales bacterium]|nr:type II toxin-antitoxin system VapC family toxin [Phycisphaerales bacterium]